MSADHEAAPAADAAKATLVRYLDAPRERVFRMWRDPQLFRAWSAPTGFRMSVCICDFQPGGSWHCRMVAPDGTPHRAGGRAACRNCAYWPPMRRPCLNRQELRRRHDRPG